MNDTAIKNFCMWARTELMNGVRQRMMEWDISENADSSADAIHGKVLSSDQKKQRAEIIKMAKAEGEDSLVERAAYTWFNRMLAIRFMGVNDRLPSGIRVFSSSDDSFSPQILKEALTVDIEGLDRNRVLELIQVGDDEETFRYLFLAQCNELAACMPHVFERVGSAMELLLPSGLLRQGGVIQHLVNDIPEEDWREGVQIIGWMYQYYNAERKDDVFASFKKGKKAEATSIAPATQLFTPDWIVRYLVENSLGRLWMLNYPNSSLRQFMDYYINPDKEHEEGFKRISSPEEISVVDPACGSGHILVYAFDLLARMYEEAGYARRDIPQLILERNLTGIEIDSRAASLASFSLTMCALNIDSRFLRRGVVPKITTLESVEVSEDEVSLVPVLENNQGFMDTLSHLGECGSLYVPTSSDLIALKDAINYLSRKDDILSDSLKEDLEHAETMLGPLSRRYDVVVANPPYMGSSNMNAWLAKWVAKKYPDAKRDLFSAFIIRNLEFADSCGELGFMTPYVWMFISSYEKLRETLIDEHTITSLIQLEYSGFAGATVPICTFTLCKAHIDSYKGGYVRLSDFVGADNQAPKALEAISNPECGWFYRRNAEDFKDIPGIPIAYWASEAMMRAFRYGRALQDVSKPKQGMVTRDNHRFLRIWFECSKNDIDFECDSHESSLRNGKRWNPCTAGGKYRKWYGNNETIAFWENGGKELIAFSGPHIKNREYYFLPAITWTAISSAHVSMRFVEAGSIPEHAGNCLYGDVFMLKYLEGLCNSSIGMSALLILSPTLNFNVGDISAIPVIKPNTDTIHKVVDYVEDCISLSKVDWDSFETSWDFKRNPLV